MCMWSWYNCVYIMLTYKSYVLVYGAYTVAELVILCQQPHGPRCRLFIITSRHPSTLWCTSPAVSEGCPRGGPSAPPKQCIRAKPRAGPYPSNSSVPPQTSCNQIHVIVAGVNWHKEGRLQIRDIWAMTGERNVRSFQWLAYPLVN